MKYTSEPQPGVMPFVLVKDNVSFMIAPLSRVSAIDDSGSGWITMQEGPAIPARIISIHNNVVLAYNAMQKEKARGDS